MILGAVVIVFLLLLALALCNAAGRESRWEERWQDEDDGYGCHEIAEDDKSKSE